MRMHVCAVQTTPLLRWLTPVPSVTSKNHVITSVVVHPRCEPGLFVNSDDWLYSTA